MSRLKLLGSIVCLFFSLPLAAQPYCDYQKTPAYIGLNSDSERTAVAHLVAYRTANKRFFQQTLQNTVSSFVTFPTVGMQGGPKSPYILTADIMPHFALGGPKLPIAVHFTPRFQVRLMYDNKPQGDSSFPVRTPSYMPGLTVFFPLMHKWNAISNKFLYGSVAAFHHSNGQDAPALRYNPATGIREVNTYNGNFSTNFIEAGANLRWRTSSKLKNDNCFCSDDPFNDHVFHLGIEQHFAGDTSLRPAYGNTRINFSYQFIKTHSWCTTTPVDGTNVPLEAGFLRELGRIVFNATFIAGPRSRGLDALDNRINADLQIHVRWPGSPNLSIFTGGGYFGSDPYNIYFEKHYFYFRLGLGMGFFIAPSALHGAY